ncbi:murein L,D-transpeptidase family protein [Caulobacter sp. 17J80-11]|uniref:L,D-transpeptidase family protein n=1 Tax=Caulobacter sp. 17J80-11 TaxID=2763502 RepID=UPI001653722B|nr:murein L,D-transpeptidase family protein [Caulobacter sp. 17J80-11]MBC6983085.1 murein L,D-transpeptidase [Caulobacter sp. 17J80-11]
MKARWLTVGSLVAGLAAAGAVTMLAPTTLRERAISREHAARKPLPERLAAGGFRRGQPVFLRILKQEGRLELWMRRADGWRQFESYRICARSGGLGPKLKEGDGQAPEGFYLVGPKQLNPHSAYHLAFNLGFPNAYDAGQGRTGSALMVHGACASAGCFAMTDGQVEEIYGLVEAALREGQAGVPVHVFPFAMTPENLARHRSDRSAAFWANLSEGWALFEATGAPPTAYACRGRYGFAPNPGCTPVRPWA